MACTSLELLYHSPESLLTSLEMKLKILKLLSFLIREAIEAITAFYIDNAMWKFDPHVGETSCQVRAYRVLCLKAEQNGCLSVIKKKIETFKDVLAKIAQVISGFNRVPGYSKEVSTHQKLEIFLSENELMFEMSHDIKFIVLSYILTKFKEEGINGVSYIDYIKLCCEFDIPRKLGKKLIHYYQVKLADDSINFIESSLKKLPKQTYLSFLLKYLKNIDDDNRAVLPCYLGMKILLSSNFEMRTPILVVVSDEYPSDDQNLLLLLFQPDEDKNDFVLLVDEYLQDDFLSKPCVVVYGIVKGVSLNSNFDRVKYINIFRDAGLANILLSNMADHPQYSGNKLNALSFNPFKELYGFFTTEYNGFIRYDKNFYRTKTFEKEFLNMKKIGKAIGCVSTNAPLFLIKHIFCDTLCHQLSMLNKLSVDNCLVHSDMNEKLYCEIKEVQYAGTLISM